jgi:hypothetical protein
MKSITYTNFGIISKIKNAKKIVEKLGKLVAAATNEQNRKGTVHGSQLQPQPMNGRGTGG